MYQETPYIVRRLVNHYKKHGNIIIAYDFDDTIQNSITGKPNTTIVGILKHFEALKFPTLLYTCREDGSLDLALQFLETVGLKPTYVNESPYLDSRKPYFNILLDDKAGLGQALEALKIFSTLLDQPELMPIYENLK